MPFVGDIQRFLESASHLVQESGNDTAEYFEGRITESFIDKLKAGIQIPNYPQFRDMNKMFFEMIDGIRKMKGGIVETGALSMKGGNPRIPEVFALRTNSKKICEKHGGPFRVKFCITGPYTLSSFFVYRDPQLYGRLGELLSKIVDANIFDNKYGATKILSVDEPVFGLVDEPTLDVGSAGRENLLHAWEEICYVARQKGLETCLHLHNTTNELFWQIGSLRIVESHVDDPLYLSDRTRKLLESNDKVLKASICVTIFDRLIEKHLISRRKEAKDVVETEKIGAIWKAIREGKVDPEILIEKVETMEKRLRKTIRRFSSERVPYAGSECGMISFPTYECALECLRRVSRAVETVSREGS